MKKYAGKHPDQLILKLLKDVNVKSFTKLQGFLKNKSKNTKRT
jgi:hypothetical protein